MAAPDFRLIAWLRQLGYDAHITPPSGKSTFVVVQGFGGETADMLSHLSYAVQFYAPSPTEAASAAWQFVKQARMTKPGHGIASVSVDNGPYVFPDPERQRLYRYQLTITIVCRLAD